MSISTEEQAYSFLFRLSSQDTFNKIGFETFEKLMQKLGLSKNEVMHLALMNLAQELLPSYDADIEDLTEAQIQYLRDTSPAKDIPEECFITIY